METLGKIKSNFYFYNKFFQLKPKPIIYRGVVSIAISLNKFDLKQCGKKLSDIRKSPLVAESEINFENGVENHYTTNHFINTTTPSSPDPFHGTDKCDRITTDVIIIFLLNTIFKTIN